MHDCTQGDTRGKDMVHFGKMSKQQSDIEAGFPSMGIKWAFFHFGEQRQLPFKALDQTLQ